MDGGKKEEGNVLVLIDYENIAKEASGEGKVVDFRKLAELCRSFGRVVASILFVPTYQLRDTWFEASWEQGFFPLAIPFRLPDREKQYRTADTMMIDFGTRMSAIRGFDRIVIVSNDSDFITLINHACDDGKDVILVSGSRVSQVLVKAVNFHHLLPVMKEGLF